MCAARVNQRYGYHGIGRDAFEVAHSPEGGLAEEYLTLTVPMAICNALILTIARLDEGRSLKALGRLTELTRGFAEVR